jgi:hypothetical protein|tara:strand:- start:2377 stop:2652 length:276 start_codon:yes stop_codon:yes gene_type:complete
MKITRTELKELVKEVMLEGRIVSLEMPKDNSSQRKIMSILTKLKVPKDGTSSKEGYNIVKKKGKQVIEIPTKHVDDVIEQMIKMNVSVRSI